MNYDDKQIVMLNLSLLYTDPEFLNFTLIEELARLGQIDIDSSIFFASLQIIPLNQTFHTLLDELGSGDKSVLKLFGHFCNEFIVVQHFSRFHDTHDDCFHQMTAILLDFFRQFSGHRRGVLVREINDILVGFGKRFFHGY